jgi:hypothetical protein
MTLGRRAVPGTASGLALSALFLGCQLEQEDLDATRSRSGGGAGAQAGQLAGGVGGSVVGGVGGAPIVLGGAGGGAMSGAPAVPQIQPGLPLAPIATPPAIVPTGITPSEPPLFGDQVVWNMAPARRVLYSWTTPEQISELRRDRVLLTRTERPGLGRGYAFMAMDALAARGSTPAHVLLAALSSRLFMKVRYAWPHAWATRMGWPGEDYGSELIRIVLKPEAWTVVVFDDLAMIVVDANNQPIPVEEALANNGRIGAIFFYRTTVVGQGSFSACGGGYREFIVGNESMIEEWSIGTAEIRERIATDAARLERFVEVVRRFVPSEDPESFNAVVACRWSEPALDEIQVYERSLAIPSEYYLPRPAAIAQAAETLRASLFEPNPLIVTPGG